MDRTILTQNVTYTKNPSKSSGSLSKGFSYPVPPRKGLRVVTFRYLALSLVSSLYTTPRHPC